MPFVELSDGLKRYYEVFGPPDGRTVILLHGWCSTSGLFSEQKPALADAGYRVIAFDAPGHGRSDKDVHDFTPKKFIGDFREMGEALDFWNEPVALVGHSAGGGVSPLFYFEYPEHIAALALLNTGFRMMDTLPRKMIWSRGATFAKLAFSDIVKGVVTPIAAEGMAFEARLRGMDPETARGWARDIFETPSHVAAGEIAELIKHDIESRMADIRVPTCVIGGRFDTLAPARQSTRMGRLIPDSEVHILHGAHMLNMWMYREVNDILLKFLARVFPPRRPETPPEPPVAAKKQPAVKKNAAAKKTAPSKRKNVT